MAEAGAAPSKPPMGLYLASWLPALALLAVAAWLFLPDAVAAARRPRNNAKRA